MKSESVKLQQYLMDIIRFLDAYTKLVDIVANQDSKIALLESSVIELADRIDALEKEQ